MNLKVPAKLRVEGKSYVIDFQDQVIDIKHIGFLSEPIDRILDHLPRKYNPFTEDDIKLILEDGGRCYLETRQVRNLADKWEGSAINSYTTQDPIYREELVLIEQKMVIHFHIEKNDKTN